MKTYVCDSCKKIIDDPFEIKMKEFFYVADYDFGTAFPSPFKQTAKIHLCDECFNGLRLIAKEKGGAEE